MNVADTSLKPSIPKSRGTPTGGSVARQIVLPWPKSLEISVKSIRARFFRSLLTTLTLVLAVAFVCCMFICGDVAGNLATCPDQHVCQLVQAAGYDTGPDAAHGSSPRQRWIIILSLTVCTIGIINAQLMAVTERFREIGTMKCLGALDSLVLRLFLLEAAMQGLAGALVGSLLGLVVAIFMSLTQFGLATLSYFPLAAVLSSMGLSVLIGLGLSLLGVSYPALVAARMQPVEAMRAQD